MPVPSQEPVEIGIPVRPGKGLVEAEPVCYVENHVPVVPGLTDLGELLSGKDAPDLMHGDHIVLLTPVGGRKNEIGELGGRRHEEIGDHRVAEVAPWNNWRKAVSLNSCRADTGSR